MSRRALLSLIVLLTVALCPVTGQVAGQNGGRQSKKPGPAIRTGFEISGVTVNALSGELVAHVEVSIGLSEKPTALQTTITGADGHFLFRGIAPAKYWLS